MLSAGNTLEMLAVVSVTSGASCGGNDSNSGSARRVETDVHPCLPEDHGARAEGDRWPITWKTSYPSSASRRASPKRAVAMASVAAACR